MHVMLLLWICAVEQAGLLGRGRGALQGMSLRAKPASYLETESLILQPVGGNPQSGLLFQKAMLLPVCFENTKPN